MSLRSKLRIESKGMFATFVFYAVAGIVFLALLPLANFPPHIGIIGLFSLVAAYGVLMKRVWAIWFVMILFFVATTFSAFMIYDLLTRDFLLGTSMIAYLVLTWVFTAYAAAKRKSLES